MSENRLKERSVTCVGCPVACDINVKLDAEGNILGIRGQKCAKGKEYASQEVLNPVRVYTGTVLLQNGKPLPVRTDKPIQKELLMLASKVTAKIRIHFAVREGDVLIPNFLGTGANLIAQIGTGEI